ncbi:hypothetical protein [Burkholderia sp. S-53]|uniref:hypothetical protein n=1 Tax=Burkholderia sp. S-53 TaxID=2906514 RepID=UPI0021D240F5|nr:hypothetical protein [Burkholderia sp. S-53]UXU92032.1 hypothetical protein LXM88_28190 [Burkholderia sp. S-53]
MMLLNDAPWFAVAIAVRARRIFSTLFIECLFGLVRMLADKVSGIVEIGLENVQFFDPFTVIVADFVFIGMGASLNNTFTASTR